MATQIKQMKVGDKVKFDTNEVETFKTETSGSDKAIQQYQKLSKK